MATHKKINILRCLFIVFLLVFCVEIIKQEIRLHRLNSEIDATRQKISELGSQREKLQEERQTVNDPQYIERIAREEYNMVKKEEMPVFVKE
jgi:cell division protein FtsL